MKSSTTPNFWKAYKKLNFEIKEKVQNTFRLWKRNPRHPSLRFKKIGKIWSVRIDMNYRALALYKNEIFYWFWIGNHDEYERLLLK
jgi:hypothetical protein